MSETMEYKCVNCGGAMEFDVDSQNLKCPFCDSIVNVEEYSGFTPGAKMQWEEGESDDIKNYTCESCGGEIIAEDTTSATSCPYCGNKVLIEGQFADDLRPNFVIPFKKDKKDAKEAYTNFLKGKSFLPKVFKDENHIDEIKGVYVPFWIFDTSSEGSVRYEATSVNVYRRGDTEYTQTNVYEVVRGGTLEFEHIPVDGSEKMDDVLMESIEPFDFKEAVDFNIAYLAGYIADRYDVSMEDSVQRAKNRVVESTEAAFRDTIKGYTAVHQEYSDIHALDAKYYYALYPVWILNTTWEGEHFIFAMNGQTGKMVGDLPISKSEYRKFKLMLTVIFAVLVYLIVWMYFRVL